MNENNVIRKMINAQELHNILQTWNNRNAGFLEMTEEDLHIGWEKSYEEITYTDVTSHKNNKEWN